METRTYESKHRRYARGSDIFSRYARARYARGLGPLVTEQVFIDDHTTHYTLPMGYTHKAGKLVHHK